MNLPIHESAERGLIRRMIEWYGRRTGMIEADHLLPAEKQCKLIREAMELLHKPADNNKVRMALALALSRLAPFEPGHSAAVSDEFVAMYSILAGVENDDAMKIIEDGLKQVPRAQEAPEPITITVEESLTYTTAVGDAGHDYLKELVRGRDGFLLTNDVWLPGTFRWEELFNRMIKAAREAKNAGNN